MKFAAEGKMNGAVSEKTGNKAGWRIGALCHVGWDSIEADRFVV